MSPLQLSPTTLTTAQLDAKLGSLHSRFRNLGLVLRYHTGIFYRPAALRALFRQRCFHDLINLWGNRSSTRLTVALAFLPSRRSGVDFGVASGKGSCLPFRAPLRLL